MKRMRGTTFLALAALALGAGTSGCLERGSRRGSGDGDPGEGEGEGSPACVPQEQQACACIDSGGPGLQECSADGTAWSACVCSDGEGEGEGAEPVEGEGEGPAEGEGEGEPPSEGEGEGDDPGPFVPQEFPEPGDCEPDVPDGEHWGPALVMSELRIERGYGFDLDGDGEIDNSFGDNQLMPGILNSFLGPAIDKGEMLTLLELRGADDPDASACFSLNFYNGLDADGDPAGNFAGDAHFQVDGRSLGEDGAPLISFAHATIRDGTLFARADTWALTVPYDNTVMSLTMKDAHLQAELNGFGEIATGVVGGALAMGSLLTEIHNAGLPTEGLNIEQMLGPPDFDADGDGCIESYSVGHAFEAVGAVIDGIVAPEPSGEGGGEPPAPWACGTVLACGVDCVVDSLGAVDWGCLGGCSVHAQNPETLQMARSLFNCPLGECAPEETADAITACMEDRYADSYGACIADEEDGGDPRNPDGP